MSRLGNGYQTACDIQKVLVENILDPTTDKRLLAGMATAWEKLAERKRILKMQPKPRDLDVSRTLPAPARKREAFTEPTR